MSLNTEKIRADFNCLKSNSSKKNPIYFDSGCTTLRPNSVIESSSSYYLDHPSCHNRAIHLFGRETTKKYEESRVSIQKFLNAKQKEEIIFTKNTTEGINIIANGLKLNKSDCVLTTGLEHNSNHIPWIKLQLNKGINHLVINISPDENSFNLEAYKAIFTKNNIKLVSMLHVSHVTGMVFPIKEMVSIAHENGALFMLDAAQSITTQKIDVQELGVDFLNFSFHKAFGPSGVGVLYGKFNLLNLLEPIYLGGETVVDATYDTYTLADLPARLEPGLQNYAGVIASAKAIDYINQLGIKNILDHEILLNQFITKEISKIEKVSILGPKEAHNRPSIINFNIANLNMGEVSILLDRSKNIMVRSGFHCCHSWYNHHKLAPSLRISLAAYNNQEEAEILTEAIKALVKFI